MQPAVRRPRVRCRWGRWWYTAAGVVGWGYNTREQSKNALDHAEIETIDSCRNWAAGDTDASRTWNHSMCAGHHRRIDGYLWRGG